MILGLLRRNGLAPTRRNLRRLWSVRKGMIRYRRDHPNCEWCGAGPRLHRRNDVHHIVPLAEWTGEPSKVSDPSNLLTLCRSCHFTVGHKRNWRSGYNPLMSVFKGGLS